MNLDLTETQTLLQQTVREYLEKELPFDRIREIDRAQSWDEALWTSICEQGWLGLPFPEELGGGAGSLIDVGILVEEFTRRAAVIPLVEVLAAGLTLGRFAEDARSNALLEEVLAGTLRPVPALLEASDRFGDIRLERGADGQLHGEKSFVDYGQFATHHLVAAREGGELGIYLVAARSPGVQLRPLHSIGRTPQAAVRYEAVSGERIGGAEAYRHLVDLGRALASVQCLGCMQQALDMTVKYACVREQFGKPIGSFQAVRHHCANMAISVASARLIIYETLDAIERGQATEAQIAAAKASASRAVPEVTMLAHQIHGGNGMIEENDLYFFTLRGKERSLAWGTVEECLAVVGESIQPTEEWL
jgi:alkylation response protein AidB-like acyl-CoA dehydrogenase